MEHMSKMEAEFNEAVKQISVDQLIIPQAEEILKILKALNLVKKDFTIQGMMKCMIEYRKEKE